MNGWPWQLVTFDIDGTLTLGHGWRYFAERTGQLPAFERDNARFFRHEVNEDEHLKDLAGLANGRRLEEIHDILRDTPKILGISATIQALHDRGARVALLTHNPDYICAWYRDTYGFDDFEGSHAAQVVDGRIEASTAVRAAKLEGLDRLLARSQAPPRGTAHVGDGWADAAVFPRVGGGVALNSRLPEVREAADLAIDLTDLRGLLEPLGTLLPRAV